MNRSLVSASIALALAACSSNASRSDRGVLDGILQSSDGPTASDASGGELVKPDGTSSCGTVPTPAATIAELPRVQVDAAEPNTSAFTVVNVGALGNTPQDNGTALQSALDAAKMNTVIRLVHGAVFKAGIEGFQLGEKSGTGWIVIETSNLSAIPAAGTRLSSAQADALPVLRTYTTQMQPTANFKTRAHHYYFRGIAFDVDDSVAQATYNHNQTLVRVGDGTQTTSADLPHHIVFSRCAIRGHASKGVEVKNGALFNGNHLAYVDGRIEGITSGDVENHAIGAYNANGPWKIVNNFINANGIHILIGGADPTIKGANPSDIAVARNHFWKDPKLTVGSGVFYKNALESKASQRVLWERNIIENARPGETNQQYGIVFKIARENDLALVTTDQTFRYNLIINAAGGVSLSNALKRIHVHHNYWQKFGTEGIRRFGQTLSAYDSETGQNMDSIWIQHNTAVLEDPTGTSNIFSLTENDSDKVQNVRFEDNVVHFGTYGFFGSNSGTPAVRWPNSIIRKNIIIQGSATSDHSGGPDNYYPQDTSDFLNPSGYDYSLKPSSTFKNGATDGIDPGVPLAMIQCLVAGVKDK